MLACCTLLFWQSAVAQDFFDHVTWDLRKDKRGIQIYTGKIDGSKHRAVFSTMEINASVQSVVALLLDLPNCRQWVSMCKHAAVTQNISATEKVVYGHNDLPFPVRDRDSYSRVKWFFNPDNGVVSMDSESLEKGAFPRKKGVIRVDYAHASWRIVPTADGTVIIENYIHVDPNGSIPVWLTNALVVDSPYKALKKMRKVLASGKYEQSNVAFLPAR